MNASMIDATVAFNALSFAASWGEAAEATAIDDAIAVVYRNGGRTHLAVFHARAGFPAVEQARVTARDVKPSRLRSTVAAILRF